MKNDLIISDYALPPQDAFTHISDAHNTTSWIDHFVSSFSVHQAMFYEDVLSAYSLIIGLSQSAFSAPTFLSLIMRWWSPSKVELTGLRLRPGKEKTCHESKNLLDQLQLPIEVRHCQNFLLYRWETSGRNRKLVCRDNQCFARCCILCKCN